MICAWSCLRASCASSPALPPSACFSAHGQRAGVPACFGSSLLAPPPGAESGQPISLRCWPTIPALPPATTSVSRRFVAAAAVTGLGLGFAVLGPGRLGPPVGGGIVGA